eukprot:2119064-Lingulodinium_polyedra.AAC.1
MHDGPVATPRGRKSPGGRPSPLPARDRSRERHTTGSTRRIVSVRSVVKKGLRTLSRGSGSSGPTA